MSDGSLRFLAILVALLRAPTVDTTPQPLASQADGNRYDVARRLVALLRIAVSEESHWRVLQTRLGAEFLTALCDGASTGESLEALAAAKVGAGDVAILVERDQFLSSTAIRNVQVWTFDEGLAAQAAGRA